jgi:hypothetical protein
MAHRDKFGRPTFGRKRAQRDESNEAVRKLPISLPLKIRSIAEAFAIEDAAGRVLSYTYFEDEPSSRTQTRRFSKDEAREIAQAIARLMTDVQSDDDISSSKAIPLEDLSAEDDE